MQSGIFIIDQLTLDPLNTLFFLIGLVIAVTVHEFAHAYTAARQQDETARVLGRVSLNPLAHLDPAGSLLFLFAGIGWGKPVPVNPANLKDGRRGDFLVSVAGILTNLGTAFVFLLPLQIIRWLGGDITDFAVGGNAGLAFCVIVAEVNILLAAFNLLPLPPLDGSRMLGALLPYRLQASYQDFMRVGPVLLIGVLAASVLLHINILGWIIDPLRSLFRIITFLPTSLGG